jgi:hypothetical protein
MSVDSDDNLPETLKPHQTMPVLAANDRSKAFGPIYEARNSGMGHERATGGASSRRLMVAGTRPYRSQPLGDAILDALIVWWRN